MVLEFLMNLYRNVSLLNVSTTKWPVFMTLLILQLLLSMCLFVLGTACLAVGIEFSFGYREINCSDSLSIWVGLLTLLSSLSGLFASRVLHIRWPTLVYLLNALISVSVTLALIVDGARMADGWKNIASTSVADTWAYNFFAMDTALVVIAAAYEIVTGSTIALLAVTWIKRTGTGESTINDIPAGNNNNNNENVS